MPATPFRKRARASSSISKASTTAKSSQKSLVNKKWTPAIPRWGFPRRMYISHRYVEIVTLTSTASSVASNLHRCNGMYDPNYTGTGHQPMYFDNLAAIYDHYTVVKSTCKIIVTPATSNSNPIQLCGYVDDDTTVATSIEQAAEQGDGVYRTMAQATNQVTSINLEWSARKYFGGDALSNDNLQGTGTSDPTEQSFFTLLMQVSGGSTQSVYATFEITYYAIWDELKTQSLN